jgi:hypothetical protein
MSGVTSAPTSASTSSATSYITSAPTSAPTSMSTPSATSYVTSAPTSMSTKSPSATPTKSSIPTPTPTSINADYAPVYKDVHGNIFNSAGIRIQDANGNLYDLKGDMIDASGNIIKSANIIPTPSTLFYTIFNQSTISLLIWFFVLYLIAYLFLGIFTGKTAAQGESLSATSRLLDFIILGALILYIISTFFSYTEADKQVIIQNFITNMLIYVNEPYSIISLSIFIFVFYLIIYLFGIPMGYGQKPVSINIFESILFIILLIILFVDFFKYVLGIYIIEPLLKLNILNNIPTGAPIVQPSSTSASTSSPSMPTSTSAYTPTATSSTPYGTPTRTLDASKNEVFNVANNLYTYDDAQAVCAAYGAKLATYDQIESAYNDGAEWCNYGWSDGQMAFFPTQKSTWDDLQKTASHKNDCGRPGVNGGYIANPYVEFGVNCYGQKPPPTSDDLAQMSTKSMAPYPKSQADIDLEKKIEYWKTNASQLLKINSYNNKKWSEY